MRPTNIGVVTLQQGRAGGPWRQQWPARLTLAMLMLLLLLMAMPAFARGPAGSDSVALASLPREARSTYALILSGGPFPHAKDGVTFGNREGMLPRERRGHYREYTVPTPGARNRGARRIVCGGAAADWARNRPAACWYTDDHYASFRQIRAEAP